MIGAQAPKVGDLGRRADVGRNYEISGSPAECVAPDPNREAVGQALDQHAFDPYGAGAVRVELARDRSMAFAACRLCSNAMNGGPLLYQLLPITQDHPAIICPMPYGNRGDASLRSGHLAHATAPFGRSLIDPRSHTFQCP